MFNKFLLFYFILEKLNKLMENKWDSCSNIVRLSYSMILFLQELDTIFIQYILTIHINVKLFRIILVKFI